MQKATICLLKCLENLADTHRVLLEKKGMTLKEIAEGSIIDAEYSEIE